MSCHISLTIQNASGGLRIVRIEPSAHEFATVPDEKLEVIVRVESGTPSLRVVEASTTTLIYTEECDGVCVVQAGIAVDLARATPIRPARASHDFAPAWPIRPTRHRDNPMWDRELDF